ncbi:MAG TPA: glycosyltransferase family 2 protein [Solirubrobacter sp.]|nr:glycosyltransferase family 2 protein [Solirubrobacter sp.]
MPHDLAIIIVAMDRRWIRPCLRTVFAHAGDGVALDVVVVDNDSPDATTDMVTAEFPRARAVRSPNHGFGHANNRGLMTCDARYVLFLNPDTEILEGTFAELVRLMDARPLVGLIGARQITPEGRIDETIRRFPNALRALGEAAGVDRFRGRPRWLGERELDLAAYDREVECDWTSGSFMLVRREALASAGGFDERFFMYSEETDLCRRIKSAGWEIRHVPQMTILHHGGEVGINPRIESLGAMTRIMYARKHFSPGHRLAYTGAIALRHGARAVYAGKGERGALKRAASQRVLTTLLGREPIPFAELTAPVAMMPAGTPVPEAAEAPVGVGRGARTSPGAPLL